MELLTNEKEKESYDGTDNSNAGANECNGNKY